MRFHCALLFLALTLPLAAQSTMFRGNPAHTGVYPAPSSPLQGKISWSFETLGWDQYQKLENMDGGSVWPTTPAVAEGRIHFAAGPFVFALDETGKLLDRFNAIKGFIGIKMRCSAIWPYNLLNLNEKGIVHA